MGMRKPQEPTPLRNDAVPLSGLQRNSLVSLVHFVTYTTKQTRDASALRWRPERGTASFRSGVGFLRLSHPHLVSVLFPAPLILEMKFFQKLFPLVYVLFGGFLNRFSPEHDITLQTNVFIASDEIASATHLNTISHYRRNVFIASDERVCAGTETDGHFWRWR